MRALLVSALLLCACSSEVKIKCATAANCPSGMFCGTDFFCTTSDPCPGGASCGAACVQTQTDVANCGACGQACAANQTCTNGACVCAAATCNTLHKACGSATDGCGNTLNCGSCATGQKCSLDGVCVCQPQTDAEICAAKGAVCGAVTATDNCGNTRTVTSCGTCGSGQTCSAGACTCTPETDAAFCARVATNCTDVTGTDNCGRSRTVSSCSDLWIRRASMPTGHAGSGYGLVGGSVVIAGGYNGAHTSDVQKYATVTDSWTSAGNRPTIQDSGPASGVINGVLYTAGGTDAVNHIADLWQYDGTTWSQLASMPGGARSQLAGDALNGIFYAVGGYGTSCGNSYCDRVEAYTPSSGWSTAAIANLSQARAGPAVAAVNGKLYAAGGLYLPSGSSSGAPSTLVEAYTPSSNTWAPVQPLPTALTYAAAAASGSKLYVFGGSDGTGPQSSVFIYDTSLNQWKPGAPMPTARNSAMAVAAGMGIYVIGGSSSTVSGLGTVELYCP